MLHLQNQTLKYFINQAKNKKQDRLLNSYSLNKIKSIKNEKNQKIKNINNVLQQKKQHQQQQQQQKKQMGGGNRNEDDVMVDRFLEFVTHHTKIKNINKDMIDMVTKSFRNYPKNRFRQICFNANTNKNIIINLDEKIAENYIKKYNEIKEYYIKNSSILLEILEIGLLELVKKNNKETFKLKGINNEELNNIGDYVRDIVSKMYYNCQVKYIQAIQIMDEYFLNKSFKEYADYKKQMNI